MEYTLKRFFDLRQDRAFLVFILCLALAHGLLYVFLVPPWQHYDEPGRFEYAWLIANQPGLPEPGDESPSMRRELLASMVAQDFFEHQNLSHVPSLIDPSLPWIGISQLKHDFGYYSLVALPLRLLRHTDLTIQLYVGRLVSLMLYIATLGIAWGLIGDLILRGGRLFRRTVVLVMVLLPSFVDIMTMVGDDVGAAFIFSLFLWGCVRLLRHGISIFRLAWVVCTAVLSVVTKNTLALTPLWVLFVLMLALIRKPIVIWGLVLGLAGLFLLTVFTWGDAALWERHTYQSSNTSMRIADSPLGRRAFVVDSSAETNDATALRQFIPYTEVDNLQGQEVTVAAWIWASQPVSVELPTLIGAQNQESANITADLMPTFNLVTKTIRADTDQIGVVLHAPTARTTITESIMLYYDGVGLYSGTHGMVLSTAADVGKIMLESGDGGTFTNYLRNTSAEQTWFRVRSEFSSAFRKYVGRLPMSISLFFASIFDWERTCWVYEPVSRNLFQTFWAVFGWGNVRLSPYVYRGLFLVTVLGVVGAVKYAFYYSGGESYQQRSFLLLALAAGLLWTQALLRVHPINGRDFFISSARYAYPAIIPTVLILTGGWLSWGNGQHQKKLSWAVGMFMLILALLAIYWNVTYYYF